jgi:SagB-type dehydrogenase family enzyme
MVLLGGGPRVRQVAGQSISLPAPELDGALTLERSLDQRRSIRTFEDGPLGLSDLGQLLWAAQGVTDRRGYRTAPSAGALYPLEVFAVVASVEALRPGVYRYDPRDHALHMTASGDRRRQLQAAALDQSAVGSAPAVLVITGVYARTAAKYGSRAQRYVHMEAGHASQNVYLQSTALGLATVLIGAFDDRRVQEVLELPSDHEPLGLMPVGRGR